MKINRICALAVGLFTTLACTTLAFASEENKQELIYNYEMAEGMEIFLGNLKSLEAYSSPYLEIDYTYSEDVQNGKVRYMSQIKQSKYFNAKYWGKWDGNTDIKCGSGTWYGGPIQECGTCSISMTLSYIGIDKTPEDILNFGSGITISNTSWGGATYKSSTFATAFDNFINGNGKYSPPVIHLDNYTSAGHYVVVIGSSSENVYEILDPAQDKVWEMTIKGSNATYTLPNGKTKSDTVTHAYQYYKEDSVLVKPFKSCVDTKTDSVTFEGDVTVEGWAVYGKEITKVEGIVNGNTVDFTQFARTDVAKAYPGYPTGKEGFSGTVPASYLNNGTNKLELIAYSDEESFPIKTIRIEYNNLVSPEITDVFVTGDAEGYTINCTVSDDLGIDRVQFPTWTAANGQDDLDKNWPDSAFSKGSLEDGVATYRVKYADHNYESGEYITHIYAFDVSGNKTTYSLKHFAEEVLLPTATPMSVGCGNNLTYEISEDMILTISGTGSMYDWSENAVAPWNYCADDIIAIIIEEGVTGIGAEAFKNFTSLDMIILPASVVTVGDNAFTGCTSLKSLLVLGSTTEIGNSQLNETVIIAGYPGSSAEMLALVNGLTFRALGGDVNSDGLVNANDALFVLKHAAGLEKFTDEIILASADMNTDEKIDASDALEILKKAAGLK